MSLAIASICSIGPWGRTSDKLGEWLDGTEDARSRSAELTAVPGFIESGFNPLVQQCFAPHFANGKVKDPRRLAVVLGSTFGDTTTADLASMNLLQGKIHNALLFYQSVPNSILGYLSREQNLTEMFTCFAGYGHTAYAGLSLAELYLGMDSVEQVLVIGVETRSDRADEMFAWLNADEPGDDSFDWAVSLLVENAQEEGPSASSGQTLIACAVASEQEDSPGFNQSCPALLEIARAVADLEADRGSASRRQALIRERDFGGNGYEIKLSR
jgi:hypothetical protein